MANQEQLDILKQGVDVWNKWREEVIDTEIKTHTKSIEIDLSEAYLRRANLNGANLISANLTRADLSEAMLLDADLGGADLSGASLFMTRLIKASFFDANLSGANLDTAILNVADLRQANLKLAILHNARLTGANLSEAFLREADLKEAELIGTNFARADLRFADLSKAVLGGTIFSSVDLSCTNGLEDVKHLLSSSIGTDTIQLSKGKIPTVFLRGCGLGDLDIEYTKLANLGLDPEQVTDITYKIHQLYVKGGIQYYSCFISYNSKDEEFAKHLYDDLQNNGVRCWFAPEDLKIGDPIRPTIDRQIRLRDKLLVILSENSIKSEWVGDEVEGALEEEHNGNRSVLFPIRLDDTALNSRDDWAAKIKRRRHIGDFSNWKDKASYQKTFERLLRDLKATGE